VLYVDELNLLDEGISNLLLNVLTDGVNIIEREGISIRHPCVPLMIARRTTRTRGPCASTCSTASPSRSGTPGTAPLCYLTFCKYFETGRWKPQGLGPQHSPLWEEEGLCSLHPPRDQAVTGWVVMNRICSAPGAVWRFWSSRTDLEPIGRTDRQNGSGSPDCPSLPCCSLQRGRGPELRGPRGSGGDCGQVPEQGRASHSQGGVPPCWHSLSFPAALTWPESFEDRVAAVEIATKFQNGAGEVVEEAKEATEAARTQVILAREWLKDVAMSKEQMKYLVTEAMRGQCQVSNKPSLAQCQSPCNGC